MAGAVRLDVTAGVATITLDNEDKRNSLDFPMLGQLKSIAEEVGSSADIAAVVMRGAGQKAFCAGADFDAFSSRATLQEGVVALEKTMADTIAALESIPSPMIAAIGGSCFGGGVQIALCADIRLAGEGSRFGIPAVQVGLPYPLPAIERLVALVGPGIASQIFLTGMPFDAAAALRYRLIDEMADGDVFERAIALAKAIAGQPTPNARAYKKMIRGIFARPADETVAEIHRKFSDEAHYLPKLEEVAAKRLAKKKDK
jgi:enoyl-CoA hydratase/carnithine racemase